MRPLYTIGYEGADPDRFLAALQAVGAEAVVDVRAVALSRKRGFSKSALRENLAAGGVDYRHLVDLGTPKSGRDAARAGDVDGLRRIYCEQLETPGAQQALEELAAYAGARSVCLLCFERDPARCHRRIIVERLVPRGFEAVDLAVV